MTTEKGKTAGRSRSILAAQIAGWRAHAFILPREFFVKMRRQKGAKHAHASILAAGRKLCAEANEARRRNCAARREAKKRAAILGAASRVSFADL